VQGQVSGFQSALDMSKKKKWPKKKAVTSFSALLPFVSICFGT
jgi:hypothetical protein